MSEVVLKLSLVQADTIYMTLQAMQKHMQVLAAEVQGQIMGQIQPPAPSESPDQKADSAS